MFLSDAFFSLSERGRLLVVVLFFLTAALLLSLLIGGWWATSIVIVPAIVSILQVTKGVWTPEGGGKSKIGLVSLGIAILAVFFNQLWKPSLDALLGPLYEVLPVLKDKLPSESPSIVALLFLTAVILIVNYFARDKTAMKAHPAPIEKEFPEKEYKQLLESFAGVLLDDLNKIDRETNWSAEFYTPLDAEVEIKSGTKRLKKITNLLSAIRSDRKSRVFLVLGVPGSGKSVALRKLCRDLLKEIRKTGKVPLYVNLREWEISKPWTEENPPTVDELYNFILANLKSRGDVFTNEFLDKYFKKMFENGRLFIVLDSFDEIPSVMDTAENSWLIDGLSDVIYRFLGGAHESRGILSSRIFRRPTNKFDAKTIFEIRPFTENKIVETLKRSLSYDDTLITLLFNTRQELIPVARNPFTAALISSYAKENNNTLPQNQSELYSSYINKRLETCRERIERKNLNNQIVVAGAIEIADLMLTTQTLGLEASVRELKDSISDLPIEDVIDVLTYARLGRLGGGYEKRFSFVHRRFNEYFVVQRLIERPQKVPQDAIPNDSRWRDALVLYCEVASEQEAVKIAEFCWSEVCKLNQPDLDFRDSQYLRSIHCLRFLKEAFRARLSCINSFHEELSKLIFTQIEDQQSLLSLKLSVEAVGLLEAGGIDVALVKALETNNQWINETALKSCYYLPTISGQLNKRLMFYIESISLFTFFKRRHEIAFSLKLSNIFSDLRRYCTWRIVDCYCLLLSFLLCAVLLFPVSLIPLMFGISFIVMMKSFVVLAMPPSKVLTTPPSKTTSLSVSSTRDRILLMFPVILAILFLATIPSLHTSFISAGFSNSYFLICFILVILVIPWHLFFYFAVPSFFQLKGRLKEFILICAILLGIFALFGVAMAVLLGIMILIDSYYEDLGKIILSSLFILGFGIPLGSALITIFKNWHHDLKMKKKAKLVSNATREEISEQFHKFKTPLGRLRYVKSLQLTNLKPTGFWLDGKIPNIRNDQASTLLAQLEEKWLGLSQ